MIDAAVKIRISLIINRMPETEYGRCNGVLFCRQPMPVTPRLPSPFSILSPPWRSAVVVDKRRN